MKYKPSYNVIVNVHFWVQHKAMIYIIFEMGSVCKYGVSKNAQNSTCLFKKYICFLLLTELTLPAIYGSTTDQCTKFNNTYITQYTVGSILNIRKYHESQCNVSKSSWLVQLNQRSLTCHGNLVLH